MRRVLKILGILFLVILIVIIGAFIAIQTPYVQNIIVQKVLVNLNQQFGTQIKVGSVDIDFWGDVNLYDVSIKDHKDLDFIVAPQITADLSYIDLIRDQSNISLDQIDLKYADIQVITYAGEEESNFIKFVNSFVIEDSSNDSEFLLRGNLNVVHSKLSIINENLPANERVWLDAENLNAEIVNVDVAGSTYSAQILEMNFDAEKNGEKYRLEELSSMFKMTDKGIFLDELRLETQSSLIDGHVHLTYDSIAQFSDFGNKILWDIQLGDADKLAYKDLRYFMPDWTKDEVISISGSAKGTLNDLNLENFIVQNGNTRIQTKHINLGELLAGSYVVSSDYIELNTSYSELIRILPDDIAKNLTDYLARFGNITYKGRLQLNETDLLAKGYLTSALGNADVNLKMFGYNSKNPTYNGTLKTPGFDLQKLTDTQELGKVAGNIAFDGRGFDVESMRINADGKLDYLDLNGARYQNITVDGTLNQQRFDGLLAINDPNAKLNYDGIFDFSSKHLKADFTSRVDFINLNYFGITTRRNSWFKGNITGDASFSDLNDLEGNVTMTDVTFNSDTLNLKIPLATLNVNAVQNMQRELILDFPGYLYANILGKFQIEELPDVLQNGIGNFLVDYKKKPVSPNQQFTFNIDVQNNIVEYFVPGFYLQPETKLSGVANDYERLFEVQMISPFIQYQDYKADSVNLFLSTTNNKSFSLTAKKVDVQNYPLHDFKVSGNSRQDTIVANAHFFGGNQRDGEFDLNFYQTFNDQKQVKTGFAPSTINIENQIWQINPNNDQETNYAILDFDNNRFIAKEILFQSEDQILRVNGDFLNKDNFNIDADIENVSLAKVIPASVLGDFKLEGIANGTIDVIKTSNELKPVADLRIDSLRMNNYDIGNFVANATYDVEQEIFNIEGSLDRDNVNTLYITGSINNQGQSPELDLVANMDDFNINILSVFLEDVLSEWSGTLSGDVSLKGNALDPSLNGFVTAEDLGFKVVYLGTKYKMNGENDFILQKEPGTSGYLTLPDVEFTETSSNTKGRVDGLLIFSDLSNWFLDLDFMADRLLVLNTTVADNEQFYGRAYAGGNFSMYGPASDMELVSYDAKVLRGSNISLNTGATATVNENRFIQFYSYDEMGNLIEPDEENQRVSGFTMDVILDVDEGTTVNLVLDAQSNDQIIARGNAEDFRIAMNKAGNLSINGEYEISEGIYNYREALVIDKDFELEDGGYIRFDGDPYNASLDIKAVYSRYVNNMGEYLGLTTTQATIVDLIIAVSGTLEDMSIEFEVEAPEASSQARSVLANRMSNEDEKMNQASFLLVLGRFGTEELLSAGTATNAATASAFELLSKQVSNLLSSLIPGLELNASYLQATNQNTQSDLIQTQANLAVNERLTINGAVGTPLGSEYNEPVTMQVELGYDISKNADGGLILKGFSRPTTLGIENFNVNSTYAQSYGVGVVYNRSFNNFRELFKRKKEEKPEEESIFKASDSTMIKQREEERLSDTLTYKRKSKNLIQFGG